MDDDVRWKIRVSQALLQTYCMRSQATVAREAAEQPAGLASQTLR